MLNEDNSKTLIKSKNPLNIQTVSNKGSFACRRPIGEGYYDEDKKLTFFAWNEKGMDIWLGCYNHMTQEFEEPECVWINNMKKRWDYHNYVTLIKGPDGQAMFYHTIHSHSLYQIVKDKDGSWIKTKISSDSNAYPSPICVKGIIYIFYSQNTEISWPYRVLRYIKSKDGGKIWSKPRTLIDSEKKADNHYDEVYGCSCEFLPSYRELPDRICLTWQMWGGPRGHAAGSKGAYITSFHLDDEKIYTLDGRKIGDLIDHKSLESKCLIEKGECRQHSHIVYGPVIANDYNGHVIIIYGIWNHGKCYLKEAIINTSKKDLDWSIRVISEDYYNVKDIKKDEDSLSILLSHGDSMIVMSKSKSSDNWLVESITNMPINHKNNSFPYYNFIKDSQKEVEIILGSIDLYSIEDYYEGLWPVYVLGRFLK